MAFDQGPGPPGSGSDRNRQNEIMMRLLREQLGALVMATIELEARVALLTEQAARANLTPPATDKP
jgi:hypothetical protein